MNEVEAIAWFAGLFEGEGYISLLPRQGIRVGINMTDKDILDKVHNLFGGRFDPFVKRRQPHHKDIHRWLITRWSDAIPLLKRIQPYMGQRRSAKILDAIIAYEANGGRRKGTYVPCTEDLGISNAGYLWHQRHNQLPACSNCMDSYRKYMADWRAKKKASAGSLDDKPKLVT